MPRTKLLPRRAKREVSRGEHVLGMILLALLAGSVGLFAFAGTGPGPVGLPAPEAPAGTETLPLTSPGGWPRGPIETYDAEGLFEKIDGKADAYIAYDVVGLEFASYSRPDAPDRYVDVYLYDMRTPLLAFGIFRSERSGAEPEIEIGEEAHAPGATVFVRKGRYYLQVLPSDESAGEEARALAEAVADTLPPGDPPAVDPPWFPEEGRTVIRYDVSSCLMVESLRDAYLALYEDGTKAFVARYETADEAAAALADAMENFEFLGTAATLTVVGRRVVGVVGTEERTRLDEVLRRLEESR